MKDDVSPGFRPGTVRAGWLLDGTGKPPVKDAVIRLANGRIESIDCAESSPQTAPANTGDALDLSACTVLPGLVDCHCHLFLSGSAGADLRKRQMAAENLSSAASWIAAHLESCLQHGIVAVRDAGDRHALARQFRSGRSNGLPIRMVCTGRAWRRRGRYGRFIGRSVDSGAALAEAIRSDRAPGEQVKVIQSGVNSLKTFGRPSRPQFSLEELRLAVSAAAACGRPVMAHANGAEAVRIALEAGCRSVEHGFFMGNENLIRMAESGAFWAPTACTMKMLAESSAIGAEEKDICILNLRHQLEQIAKARRLGVRIVVGTDSGSPGVAHGQSVIEEMSLLAAAGCPPEETVCYAARNGAELLGLSDLGVLEKAKSATLIAVAGSPENLPASLDRTVCVIVDGIVWHGRRMPALKESGQGGEGWNAEPEGRRRRKG